MSGDDGIDQLPFAERMMHAAKALRAAADAAWLPAVRSQLMSRVIEYENAAASPLDETSRARR